MNKRQFIKLGHWLIEFVFHTQYLYSVLLHNLKKCNSSSNWATNLHQVTKAPTGTPVVKSKTGSTRLLFTVTTLPVHLLSTSCCDKLQLWLIQRSRLKFPRHCEQIQSAGRRTDEWMIEKRFLSLQLRCYHAMTCHDSWTRALWARPPKCNECFNPGSVIQAISTIRGKQR